MMNLKEKASAVILVGLASAGSLAINEFVMSHQQAAINERIQDANNCIDSMTKECLAAYGVSLTLIEQEQLDEHNITPALHSSITEQIESELPETIDENERRLSVGATAAVVALGAITIRYDLKMIRQCKEPQPSSLDAPKSSQVEV